MQNYHNNISHSLLLGIPTAVLIAAILYQIYHSDYWLWFLLCFISYDLHVVMDALTAERGVMMFWPLSQNRFSFPIKVFYGVQWGLGWFSFWHLWTIFTESVFVLILVTVVNYFNKQKKTSNTISSPKN